MDGRRMRTRLALVYAGGCAVANGTQIYNSLNLPIIPTFIPTGWTRQEFAPALLD